MSLILALALIGVAPPKVCPFFTTTDAETALPGAGTLAEVTPASELFGSKGVTCRFTGLNGGVIVTRSEFTSAALLKAILVKQREKDAAAKRQEEADRIAQAKAEEESPELRGDPAAKMTKEEEELYYPKRIQEYEELADASARYYAEPQNRSAEYSACNGLRCLVVLVLWHGNPSAERGHRVGLKSAFISAARRL